MITEDKREESVLGCPMSEAIFLRPEGWKVVEDYVCPGCAAAALHHQEVAKAHMTCHYLQRITLDGFCMSNKATTIINNNSNKVREIKYVYF